MKISEKHGVNPSLMVCYFCQKEYGVALLGRLPGDAVAPRSACYNREPCPECQQHMTNGIILISVDETKTKDQNNPWRTGGWCVVREDAIRRIVRPKELLDNILKHRVAFLPDDVWDQLGLPR